MEKTHEALNHHNLKREAATEANSTGHSPITRLEPHLMQAIEPHLRAL